MQTGTVRFFHERKDFGFISRDGPRKDVFFHRSDVHGQFPHEGQRVAFELQVAGRGPRAINVHTTE
ncbi:MULTISPECIES: cold-shock protein [Haloferax]|uniref:Cold-shock protein n=1 Tax=Haloferax marinum TaxID=2666143 RepID=A0A6A8G1V4_9EURY|nr:MULTISPECIES: cold shock domain-containing protein [Haloferax]KAB1196022.1 cold shock domain-containing protein [Haloferax sp. CBA1150]MRW95000.1 cold-shock protein [Haloferax marinum]